MKNRAKCKLCESIIESFHRYDYVSCKCEEIAVDGGTDYFKCGAKNWDNFIRLDDDDNEIIPTIKDNQEDVKPLYNEEKREPLKRQELADMLKHMAESIEALPPQAMLTPVNQYDLLSLVLILNQIFEAKE